MKLLSILQTPAPGAQMVQFRGDVITFELSLSAKQDGSAWLRTNIGRAKIARQEIIRHIEQDMAPLGRDWFDIPMVRTDECRFRLSLPLTEVGHFEAKGLFLPENAVDPLWPEGPNAIINVEPEDTCCANIIYNAFVRQFGPSKTHRSIPQRLSEWIDTLDANAYTVIPSSGTFRDLVRELDFIMGELGCRIVQLLPIHPTPTTFGRMGRYGSPYAALSFTGVDPALAEFDPKATPLEQFIELVDAIHQRNGKVLIDMAVNHTGWGAELHASHPQWLSRDAKGKIEVPGAWGVQWEDLAKLDFNHKELWIHIADIFLIWCKRGVDGFRCDAAYMIPVPAWRYIVARIREQYPETIFFLEGLGGKLSVTRDLLSIANFNWAYSELFQNYDRPQIEAYLNEATQVSEGCGNLIHFAETHDNPRLASKSPRYAAMRTALCALASCRGGFGFANGVEWYATEKIAVHESPGLNWGASHNQVEHIRRINRLLTHHPAFRHQTVIKQVQTGKGNCIALMRHYPPTGVRLLVLINLDDENQTLCEWKPEQNDEAQSLIDMLTGAAVTIQCIGNHRALMLNPGQVLCLTSERDAAADWQTSRPDFTSLPSWINRQRVRAKALEVITYFNGIGDLDEMDVDRAMQDLTGNPASFCRQQNPDSEASKVVTYSRARDMKREVMVPPDYFLLIHSDIPFYSEIIMDGIVLSKEIALQQESGGYFALVTPLPPPIHPTSAFLKLTAHASDGTLRQEAALLYLPRAENAAAKTWFSGTEIRKRPRVFLSTNGKGGMLRSNVSWGDLRSRYDCLLAANLNNEHSEDRWVMLARCRMWLVYQGYSHAIDRECLDAFYYGEDGAGYWQYSIPVGQGQYVTLMKAAAMTRDENRVCLSIFRPIAAGQTDRLTDNQPVRLIIRPDIEDRNHHETTKAFTGPEEWFPAAVRTHPNGFTFSPAPDRVLDVYAAPGAFVEEVQWAYMVHRSQDEERGMDPNSDLFSPGYFEIPIKGGESSLLTACIHSGTHPMLPKEKPAALFVDFKMSGSESTFSPAEVVKESLNRYVMKQGYSATVIAGYPWFLDWGRDALIVARGLASAGEIKTAKAVIKRFGRFEHCGTLPNMVKGSNVDNRDTSDAPLWFCLACSDLTDATGNDDFLNEMCDGRSIRQVLLSIGEHFCAGTPNGIQMDPDSGLIYSPVHFTWMDTNHPAGTPRKGYPIEIQALWRAALGFLSRIDNRANAPKWQHLADQVRCSIGKYFYLSDSGYLSDCLHANPRQPAEAAQPDDALRPNQLLAVTLKAIGEKAVRRKIIEACETLLVPGAIRSLADRRVLQPLAICHQDELLNDPHHPYQGKYAGDEDTQRKPAYHNGTAWTWLFPSFCEAWATTYGEAAKDTALSLLCSSIRLIEQGCVGHIPEILDGDYPHQQRGCDAQAWGASEWLRVWHLLEK